MKKGLARRLIVTPAARARSQALCCSWRTNEQLIVNQEYFAHSGSSGKRKH